MNSFDFSLYDPEDNTVYTAVEKKEPEPKAANKPAQVATFDFDAYDLDAPSAQPTAENPEKKKSKNPFEVKQATSEEYKNMSIREKIAYAEALEKEQRYNFSKGFSKGTAKGLSFGLSENIPGFEEEEDDDPIASGAGRFFGATAPILASGGLVGAGAKALGLDQLIKNAPRALQALYRVGQAFSTGAVYESGQQGANAVSGKEVDLSQIPIQGALFASIDSVIKGAGALGKKFLKFSPSHQAQIIEQGIIPKDLPKSQYETAEEMLNLIKGQKQNQPRPPGGGPPPPPPPGAPINPNRVKSGGEDLGLRPAPQRTTPNLQDEIGNLFSQNRFYNTTEGGKAFRKEIMNIDEDVYRGVNALYKKSRDLNSQVSEIHPQLVSKLESNVAELKKIPEPSDVQKRLIRAQDKILNELVEYEKIKDEAGNVIDTVITGYKPLNNQTIIDQVQSLRQIIDYDFAHGNTKNIFRPLINDLQEAALRAAETSGTPEAAEAINQARAGYRQWVEAFDNDYVRPFRDASNQDYSKLFKSALDFDESNMLRKILSTTGKGRELADASVREIVDKNLSKFFDNPRGANPREFDKAVRELEAVISPEQAKQIRSQFRDASSRTDIRARQQPKRQPTNDERIASKYLDKKPEDIQSMMNSRSGIKELREDFSSTPQKQQVFDRLSKQKMRSILREGNIEKEFTGDDLYKFLNKEKNYEIFSELLGETETEALRQSAKEIGKDQVKSEVRKKNVTKAAHKVAVFKTLEILLGLL